MSARAKKILLFAFYGLMTVGILAAILSFQDVSEVFAAIRAADTKYVLGAALCLLLYAALSPACICILSRAVGAGAGFLPDYAIGMTEHFFNGITPFSTGGQPFQIYAFARAGVKPSRSTSILMMNFFIHMLVINSFALCSLAFYKRFASAGVAAIAGVGFSLNFLMMILMLSLSMSRRVRNVLSRIVARLARTRLLGKFLAPRAKHIDEYFDRVQTAFRTLLKRKGVFFLCLFVRAVTMAVYYGVTFFVLRAFRIPVGISDLFFVITGTSFALTTVVFVPTPGSSGGIEFAFTTVFASIAGGAAASVAYGGMLLWRLLTYYLMMAIGLAFYIGLEIFFRVRKKAPDPAAMEGAVDPFGEPEKAAECPQNPPTETSENGNGSEPQNGVAETLRNESDPERISDESRERDENSPSRL